MVPRLPTLLQRFPTAWAAVLPPDALLTGCAEVGSIGWRHRVRTPGTTVP
jgi:hypothetical protein